MAPWEEYRSQAWAEDAAPLAHHAAWVSRLRDGVVTSVSRFPNIGVTLMFVLELEGGHKAIFKPHVCGDDPQVCQRYQGDAAHREVLAYHLDKVMRFHRTPPVLGRRVQASLFEPLLSEAIAEGKWGRYEPERLQKLWQRTIMPDANGMVLGSVSVYLDLLTPTKSSSMVGELTGLSAVTLC